MLKEVMSVRPTILRIAAVALLLLMGVQLLACEVLGQDRCETGIAAGSRQTADDDCCICCCAHIVVVQPQALDREETLVEMSVKASSGVPFHTPQHIYRPPKA